MKYYDIHYTLDHPSFFMGWEAFLAKRFASEELAMEHARTHAKSMGAVLHNITIYNKDGKLCFITL